MIGPIVVATVDAGKRRQELIGFGAAVAYYKEWLPAHPYKQEIYDALFKGLNLQILRLKNDYGYPSPEASMAADKANVEAAAASLGHRIPLLMCSWGPPAALKSNNNAKNGGTLAKENGAFVYDKYGAYWSDAIAAYAKLGISPDYVSIQNEPDWKASWETCLFTPTESTKDGVEYAGYDRALDAVYKKLKSGPNRPKLVGPETTGISDGKPENFTLPGNRSEQRELFGIAHHLYNGGKESAPDTFVPRFTAIRNAFPKKPKLMTEYDRGDWFQTAWLISDSMTDEDAAAYIYWTGIWPNGPAMIHVEDPTRQSAWKDPHGWNIGDAYYAIKHFSYFTETGDRRVETSVGDPTVKLSAFRSRDGKRLTLVLLNTSSTDAKQVKLDVKGYKLRNGKVYQSTTDAKFTDAGALSSNGVVQLPAHSISTILMR